jgi:hypothetical protein
MALEDPNAVTISQAVGAYAEAFLLIAGARTGGATKGRFNAAPTKDVPPFGCFVAGTLVETKEGLRPIEEIELGDYVLSRNERTGELEYREVVGLFVRDNQQIVHVELEDEEGNTTSIGATVEHPFWVGYRGWVGARELLPGDEVFTSRGGWLRVTGSIWLSEGQTVYNFEVDGFHNYFVGEAGAWVHNMSNMQGPTAKNAGRTGKQAKLRELADDPKVSSADRGWIKNEMRHIETGDRKTIRLPGNSRESNQGGKVLAHERGERAKDGFGYKHSNLQDTDLHKLEHKHEGY